MIRSGLQAVDAQAKLAQSLGTTVASIQTLERAGELAGVSMSGIEQATKDLTRRLSQAAAGSGPAADALDRLGLSANELIALPLDQRVGAINAAIESFVPAAERAAVAGQLFGEEGSIAMSRIDTATLRQATPGPRPAWRHRLLSRCSPRTSQWPLVSWRSDTSPSKGSASCHEVATSRLSSSRNCSRPTSSLFSVGNPEYP